MWCFICSVGVSAAARDNDLFLRGSRKEAATWRAAARARAAYLYCDADADAGAAYTSL